MTTMSQRSIMVCRGRLHSAISAAKLNSHTVETTTIMAGL